MSVLPLGKYGHDREYDVKDMPDVFVNIAAFYLQTLWRVFAQQMYWYWYTNFLMLILLLRTSGTKRPISISYIAKTFLH